MRRVMSEETRIIVFRRIDFLLREAKSKNPVKDQAITYAMRVISHYCSIGRDALSATAKKLNPRMSEKAYKVSKQKPKEWTKGIYTVHEHQEPLKEVWNWILANREGLSPEAVLEKFHQWPMVIVTRDEDSKLNKCHSENPSERYKLAGIKVGKSEGGKWTAI